MENHREEMLSFRSELVCKFDTAFPVHRRRAMILWERRTH
uniref:Uncharacterized protein n=1 Tax=Siphoviridae sp. ctngK14 TaxID=2827940 RepID=A0A8S5TC23_9CAUD|nr:MAG TPA: hypothetical protein [Siphoviridae sp. ctngK14]DAL77858.1 MAG TPA: hypothetical protein [Caudoviricetes sp.]DAP04420.1 MAG TPA: hypothetical protein [Caudoviricetes sp.]